jgi:hypothetical protein
MIGPVGIAGTMSPVVVATGEALPTVKVTEAEMMLI